MTKPVKLEAGDTFRIHANKDFTFEVTAVHETSRTYTARRLDAAHLAFQWSFDGWCLSDPNRKLFEIDWNDTSKTVADEEFFSWDYTK